MDFPLQNLIEYKDNMYEITCAASRRAYQLSMLQDPDFDDTDEKTVSLAAHQVFTREIEFRIDEPVLPGYGGEGAFEPDGFPSE